MSQTVLSESSLVGAREMAGEPSLRWRWVARAAVLLPIVVAVLRALFDGWFPVGDSALLAIRAYDVGTPHHPLLGSWTSASFALGIDLNNAGSLYYDLQAPFMWTFGRAFGIGVGTAIGIGAINAAAALGTALVGARMGGWRAERWMLLLVAALMWSMGSELLIDNWQPHALLLPFTLLVTLTVAVGAGDTRLLPVWAVVASVVVQTHVAYVYVIATLTLFVLVTLVRRLWLDRAVRWQAQVRRALTSRDCVWTAVVLAVAWVQPFWEQLFGRGEGNLQRLVTHAGGGDMTVGANTAVRIVSAVTALPPWWTRFGFEDSVVSTPLTPTADGPRLFVLGLPSAVVAVLSLAVLFGVLARLVVVLRQPSQRAARLAAVVSLAMLFVALAGLTIQAVTRTGLGSHQIRWLFALGPFVHVTILWGVVEWASARWPASPWLGRRLDVGVGAVLAALTLANLPFYAHDLGPTADRASRATLERTLDDVARFHPDGPVVYDVDNLRAYEPYSMAVMMRMREEGVEFRFDDEPMVRQMGERRRADGSERIHVRQYERAEALLYDGNGCVISLRSAVQPADEEAADALIAAAAVDLASGTLAVDASGLPPDVAGFVQSAAGGDADDALRIVVSSLLVQLVEEGRLAPTPAIATAIDEHDAILDRANSTLLVVATPASACDE